MTSLKVSTTNSLSESGALLHLSSKMKSCKGSARHEEAKSKIWRASMSNRTSMSTSSKSWRRNSTHRLKSCPSSRSRRVTGPASLTRIKTAATLYWLRSLIGLPSLKTTSPIPSTRKRSTSLAHQSMKKSCLRSGLLNTDSSRKRTEEKK